MGTRFSRDVDRDGAGWPCRPCNQTRHSARPPLREIGTALGRPAFQLEVSLVSFRARWSFDRFFCYSIFRKEAHRPRLPSHSDSHCIFAHVHRCALSFRCRLRCGTGDPLRAGDRAIGDVPLLRGFVRSVDAKIKAAKRGRMTINGKASATRRSVNAEVDQPLSF